MLDILGKPTYGAHIYSYDYDNGDSLYHANFFELAGLHKGENWEMYYNGAGAAIIYYKNETEKEYYTNNVRRLTLANTPIIYVKMLEDGDILKENIKDEGVIYLDIRKKNFYKIPVLKLISTVFNITVEDADMDEYNGVVNEHKANCNASDIFTTIVLNDDGYVEKH
mgnify:FL=1